MCSNPRFGRGSEITRYFGVVLLELLLPGVLLLEPGVEELPCEELLPGVLELLPPRRELLEDEPGDPLMPDCPDWEPLVPGEPTALELEPL